MVVSVRLEARTAKKLKDYCKAHRMTISDFIRSAVNDKVLMMLSTGDESWKVTTSNLLRISIGQLEHAISVSANFEELVARLASKSRIDMRAFTVEDQIGLQVTINNQAYTARVKREGTISTQTAAVIMQLNEIITDTAINIDDIMEAAL